MSKYFYAVRNGYKPGIYNRWEEARDQVLGFPNARHKKFKTIQEAQAFMSGSTSTTVTNGSSSLRGQPYSVPKEHPKPQPKKVEKPVVNHKDKHKVKIPTEDIDNGIIPPVIVYADGSCFGNGKEGARAGIGVYFGDGDPRNVSEPLPGDKQTNQRAELMVNIPSEYFFKMKL